jgi:outer membrane biosynthesis protein TonB
MKYLTLSDRQSRQSFIRRSAATALLLLMLAAGAAAQSTEVESPTPIGSNEISGRIMPRDVGDSRLTRYFYTFTGTPGDLVVSVESQNLNGDVDIFVAGSLRPLAKVSMYAGELLTSTSKSIYLRQRESLVLRVEARTPNDDEGSYRIRFGGSFEPLAVSETQTPETETPTLTARTDKNTRRVTSVGGRIDEPAPETTPTETPREPEPPVATSTTPPETTATTEPAEPAKPATTEPAKPPRTARTRRPGTRRGRTRPATSETERTPSTTQPETSTARTETGPRLIIETRDGMRVERYMSTVRRVTVENGLIVVTTKDGKVERQPMTNVVRMAIEP